MFFISETPPTPEPGTSKTSFIHPQDGQDHITDEMRPALASIFEAWPEDTDLKGDGEPLCMPSPHDRYMSSEEEASSTDGSTQDTDAFDSSLDMDDDEFAEEALDADLSATVQVVNADVARRISLTAVGKPKLVMITVTPTQSPQSQSPQSLDAAVHLSRSRSSSVYSDCPESLHDMAPLDAPPAPLKVVKETTSPSKEEEGMIERHGPRRVSQLPPDVAALDRQMSKRRRSETITPPRTPPTASTSRTLSSYLTTTTNLAPPPPTSRLRGLARTLTFAKRRARPSSKRSLESSPEHTEQQPPSSHHQTLPTPSKNLPVDLKQEEETFITAPPSPPSTPPSHEVRKLRRKSSMLSLGNRMSMSMSMSSIFGDD